MRYDGFISYSHAADGQLAPALQQALQRLAKPWYRRRSLEIFRDETGLSVDPHLWGAIVKALDDAEWFVLLTSPRAARSEWVNREIEHWKTHHRVDRILPVVTDGHWQWDAAAGDFTADSDAVPAALRGVFDDEPRHLDLRWARNDDRLDLRNSRFRDAVAEVAAPLHGRTKDDIEGEDVRQHRRTVRIAWSAAATLAVLTVVAVVAGGVAVVNANRAEHRRIQADAQRLAAQSQTELERPDLAFLLAAHGYRLAPDVGTASALLTSVANMPEIKRRIPTRAPVTALAASAADDRVWVGTSEGDVLVDRFSDGDEIGSAKGLFGNEVVAMSRIGDDAVVATDGVTIAIIDDTSAVIDTRTTDHAVLSLSVDQATGRLAAGNVDGRIVVWTADDATPATTFSGFPAAADPELPWVTAVSWTPDGDVIAATADGRVHRYDVAAPDTALWEQSELASPGEWVSAVTVTGDGTVVTGATDGTVGFLDAGTGDVTAAGLTRLHLDGVRGLALTGDLAEEGSVASVAGDGTLLYWNHLTGLTTLLPVRVDERAATAVAWDPADPDRGVTGGQAGGVVLFAYGEDNRRPLARPVQGWSGAADVAMSPAGDRLAVVRTVDGNVSAVTATRQPSSELVLTSATAADPGAASVRIDGVVEQLVFSPDGRVALASTGEGTVTVWDGVAETATTTEVAPGEIVNRIAVSPDGTLVATGSVDPGSESMDVAPLKLWRLSGQELIEEGRIDSPAYGYGLAFSADGSHLIAGGAGLLAIHALDGGETLTVDIPGDTVRSLAVAPDGDTLAVGLWSGPVQMIDLHTGETTGDDLRVPTRVTDMAFWDDGKVLITVSNDGSFILWDTASRSRFSDRPLTAVDPAPGMVRAAPTLAVARDFALTASQADGQLVRWSLNPDDWIAEGCVVHRRDLSDAEEQRYGLTGAPPVCAAPS